MASEGYGRVEQTKYVINKHADVVSSSVAHSLFFKCKVYAQAMEITINGTIFSKKSGKWVLFLLLVLY